ncbi:winged helix DNA-binding domain-containing protein [Cumulibacter manganitolerans]|uniref:winged helix DNA-binding domain-containing protein n=1 Tax=Cumulibacter manganitolerans TaxID=1884992 RepID=UPI0012959539|nr:winged helix DNA-binding domain-containing protein [Cumulibacter manganitolerans]
MLFSDEARRARLARRHAIHPRHRLGSPAAVADALGALHATEAHAVHLAVAARTDGVSAADVDRALYVERSLVKQLAMRRTLFAFPRDLLPATLGSASARVAAQQRVLIAKDVQKHGVTDDGPAWVERACAAVLARLADGEALTARELREQLPELDGRSVAGARKWDVSTPFAPRVLTLLGAEGRIVRGENDGHWRTSRPRWMLTESWLGERPEPLDERCGYAELVRRWLGAFGPGTEADLAWWLGATKAAVRAALADVAAQTVELESGATGYVLPGDDQPDEPDGGWAALLPVLDPSTMGWKVRDFYLPPAYVPELFDGNGNAGSTAWLDGRVVGCWVQDDAGRVQVVPVEPIPAAGRRLLEAEAERLTAFLDGVVIRNIYKSPLTLRSAVQ